MKIHTLQIVNFKSYFGRHIIGPFDKHFTCIIGPNGNGKSNILDAMLFVFGFKSSKLRQDSLASLIHSSAYGMPEQAKVSVTFVNNFVINKQQHNNNNIQSQQQTNPSNNKTQITVSRTIIRKTNHSFYQLNNTRIQWHELRQLLLSHHIDLQKNLFIILQGEVERLCQLSPQKLVQYMQYVSGSDQYLQRINMLQSQYIKYGLTMQRLKQSYNLLRKVYLMQQNQGFQLLEHIIIRINILQLGVLSIKTKNIINKHKIKQYYIQQQTTNNKLLIVQKSLQSQSQQLTTYNHQLQSNTKLITRHLQQIHQLYQQSTKQQTISINKQQRQIQYLLKDCQHKQKQIAIIQKQKRQLVEMTKVELEIKKKQVQIEDVLVRIVGDCGKQRQSNSFLKQKKNKNNIQMNNTKNTQKHLTYTTLYNIHKHQSQLTKDKLFIQTKYIKHQQQQQSQHQLLNQHLQHLITKYGHKGQSYKSKQQQLSLTKIKLRTINQQENKINNQLHILAQSLEQLNRRITQTQTQKSFITHTQKVLNQIKLANTYNILLPGKKIFTLRQIICIEQQYLHLINSITPQLDFIIVDNHNDAKQIVNFLNSKKLGRMSVILIDEVKKIMPGINTTQWKGQKPKGCIRMIDVVKVMDNNDYQKLLYWTMGNTLIAETVDDAMKAAYHTKPPYRVIAKNGVFIDLSGTMTKVPLNSLLQEDRALLNERVKVLNKKMEEQQRKLALIRQQKQQANKQLFLMMNNNNTNRTNNNKDNMIRQQQFTTKQQLLQFMHNLQQSLNKLQQSINNIISTKTAMYLQVKLKQKQLTQMIQSANQCIQKQQSLNNKLTLNQMLQLVEQHQNILAKIKKIHLSQQLIKSHNQRLTKVNNQIQSIVSKIKDKKILIQSHHDKIKQNKHQVEQLQHKIKQLTYQNDKLQQKIFVKQLDIKQIKGQISKDIRTNNHKYDMQQNGLIMQHLKKNKIKSKHFNKDISQQGQSSQIPDYQVFSGQKLIKNKNQQQQQQHDQERNQQSLPSSSTILEIRKQQKRLNQLIQTTQKHIKLQTKLYRQGMDNLRNIYQFFITKCKDDKKKQNQAQQKNIITFQDIIIDYIKVKGLADVNQEGQQRSTTNNKNQPKLNVKIMKNPYKNKKSPQQQSSSQSQQSSSSSKSKYYLGLKHIITQTNSSLQFNNPTQRVIFNGLFNTVKLINIGHRDQYKLTDFLSNKQIQYIISDNIDINNNDFKQQLLQSSYSVQEQAIKQDLLKQINTLKIQSLQQSYQQKLHQLQKQSSSLLIKNIHNTSPITTNKYRTRHINVKNKQQQQQQQQSLTQFNNNQHISYFNDKQFPLTSWQYQIFQSLAQKKNDFLIVQKQLTSTQQQQKHTYSQLLTIRQQRTTCYLTTFNMINIQVNKIYNFLTKGNAEINLTNSINPFQGLQFSVRPFNKSWKSVNLLSGGQKTLTSLALIFACQQIKKFPFYFMDQIDAALDFRNVTNLGRYIKSKQSVQHIVISLRKNMYEQCDQLVCIYKVSDVTRTIVIGMNQLYSKKDKQQSKHQQNSQSNTSTITLR